MKAVTTTIRDMLILVVVGAAVALVVNTVRAKGSVKLTKAYFALATPPTNAPDLPDTSAVADPAPKKPVVSSPTTEEKSKAPSDAPPDSAMRLMERLESVTDRPLEQGYRVVTLKEVAAIFDDPGTETGANVFVDARSDDAFEEGHIPGAMQTYHYELERYIDRVMPYAESANIVVVYCNGGKCEDSALVCGDLNEAGIDFDRLYLFKGGWQEWTANAMPVETGRTFEIGD